MSFSSLLFKNLICNYLSTIVIEEYYVPYKLENVYFTHYQISVSSHVHICQSDSSKNRLEHGSAEFCSGVRRTKGLEIRTIL